jgi:hypothetical protein
VEIVCSLIAKIVISLMVVKIRILIRRVLFPEKVANFN